MDPGYTSPMDPGSMMPASSGNMTPTGPGNMTPTSGSCPPAPGEVCALDPHGQLVQLNLYNNPNAPNPTFCVSGGSKDGQTGTFDPNNAAQMPLLMGLDPSATPEPCSGPTGSDTAQVNPPATMDIAYPKKRGQPPYSSMPRIVQRTPPTQVSVAIPLLPSINLGSGGGSSNSGTTPGSQPQSNCPPGADIQKCPQCSTSASPASQTPTAPPKSGPVNLKLNTQVASTGQQNQPASGSQCIMSVHQKALGADASFDVTVSRGVSCKVGLSGVQGVVIDQVQITAWPSHMDSVKPADASHVLYTPPADSNHDNFSLSMVEHWRGKSYPVKGTVTVKIVP
jgi:hypothetical protein